MPQLYDAITCTNGRERLRSSKPLRRDRVGLRDFLDQDHSVTVAGVLEFDAKEVVAQVWLAPGDAAARSADLSLPPPQLRTLWELAQYRSIDPLFARLQSPR